MPSAQSSSAESGGIHCPYPGLSGFDAASERWYFGRERMVSDLVTRVGRRLREGGPLVLVGASGSGKSSLLRAGLLPALSRAGSDLADAGAPGPVAGPQILLTPGERPLAALLDALASVGVPVTEPGMRAGLAAAGPLAAARRITDLAASHPGRGYLVVAVDQFETVFTLCNDAAERETFIRTLCALADPPAGDDHGAGLPAALVVIGLRADFYARCATYPELVEALQSGQVVVGPMTAGEIRDAIVRPAATMNVDVEPGLVEVVLRDLGVAATSPDDDDTGMAADPGSLPLLAHALRSVWFARDGSSLTVAAYLRAGGLTGAIAQTAEQAYTGLDAASQRAARALLMRMVRLGEAEQDTRRPARRADLLAAVPTPEAATALDTLVAARLVAADADGHHDSLQLAHEALLRSWPRLRAWLEVDRASAIALQRLTDAAEVWAAQHQDPSYLFGGTRLAAAREWLEAQPHDAALSPVAREFYTRSLRAEEAERLAAVRRTRRLRRFVAALAVLVLVAASLAGLSYQQKVTAAHARDRALSQRIAAQAELLRSGRPAIAAQLGLVAYRTAKTPQARSTVLSSLNGGAGVPTRYPSHRGSIGAVTYSPNGKLIATGSDDWTAAIWDAAHPDRRTPLAVVPRAGTDGHSGAVKAVAFNRDSTLLATGGSDRTARIWDVSTPSHPRLLVTLPRTTSDVYGLAFSPVADRLAVGGYGTTARIYDVSDPARPVQQGALTTSDGRPFHLQPIVALSFSPDGDFLAAGDLGSAAMLWYVGPRLRYGPVAMLFSTGDDELLGSIRAVAFGRDGHTVYTAGVSGRISVFTGPDLLHLSRTATLGVGTAPMTSLAIAPDGLIAAGGDLFNGPALYDPAAARTPNVFADATERARPLALLNQGAVTWTVAFGPDGHQLATGAADGALRIWEIPGPALLNRYGPTLVSAVNPRTNTVAMVGGSVTELWNVSHPYRPVPLAVVSDALADEYDAAQAAAFTPDGRVLAVGTIKRVCLYDVSDPARATIIAVLAAGTGGSRSLTFSPDGRTLAVGGPHPEQAYSATVQTWDVHDPRHPAKLAGVIAHRKAVSDVGFSPDGRLLVSTAGTVRLWGVGDPHRLAAVATLPISGNARSTAFSPDGRTLAVVGEDSLAALWDIADPTRPRPIATLPGHISDVNSAEFSPDGRTLVTAGNDTAVRVWDVHRRDRPVLTAELSRSTSVSNNGTSGIPTVGFVADGTALAAAEFTEAGVLWDLNVDQVAGRVCAQAGVGITREEWAEFLPDLPYDPPCD
ncbi:hypothetical protein MXD61_11880 [Frankia sp. AgPm24]|uniref:nSTAND1 domain-containing NTPase n=1 Tax=Frankia sp. AgPm24 TaxID=631128 RepID=UPI00201065C9|nr:hypothetical protein [Frankia sp. AgPm24]MCK9922566.1 hypothetical protein [Frankia sp. AgPm24]